MTRGPPPTSAKPLPVPLAMSTAQPSPLPQRPMRGSGDGDKAKQATTRPVKKPDFPKPKLRFEIRGLRHEGASIFLSHVDVSSILQEATEEVLRILYNVVPSNYTGECIDAADAEAQGHHRHAHIPPVRSITLILKPMGGVAYTMGKELDAEHKEIHFSLDYIRDIARAERDAAGEELERLRRRKAREIRGVVVHEMVHVWQWNGLGAAPSGLIEGVADYVRLKAGLGADHWRKGDGGDGWDAGYEKTGFFLEWLEAEYGKGMVRQVNAGLRQERYREETFWKSLFGEEIKVLWKKYKKSLGHGGGGGDGGKDKDGDELKKRGQEKDCNDKEKAKEKQ